MGRVTRSHHTGFTVADLNRSITFYQDLGFEVVMRWNPRADYIGRLVGYPDVDLHAAVLRIPGEDVFLELLEYRGVSRTPARIRNGDPGSAHLALSVENLDELWDELRQRGITSVSPPVTPTIGPNRGGRAIYLIDPDGFRVELVESARTFLEYAADRDTPQTGRPDKPSAGA